MIAPTWFMPVFIGIEVIMGLFGAYGWYKLIKKNPAYISNLVPLIIICLVLYVIVSSTTTLHQYLVWYWLIVPVSICNLGGGIWFGSNDKKRGKKR